jgi:hypothetical protein
MYGVSPAWLTEKGTYPGPISFSQGPRLSVAVNPVMLLRLPHIHYVTVEIPHDQLVGLVRDNLASRVHFKNPVFGDGN